VKAAAGHEVGLSSSRGLCGLLALTLLAGLTGCRDDGVRTDPRLIDLLVASAAEVEDTLLRDLMYVSAMMESASPRLELLPRLSHPFAREAGVVACFVMALESGDASRIDRALTALEGSGIRGLAAFIALANSELLTPLSPAQTERLRRAVSSAGSSTTMQLAQRAALLFAIGEQSAALALQQSEKLRDPFARLLLFAAYIERAAEEEPDVAEAACARAASGAWRDLGWMTVTETLAGRDWERARRAAEKIRNPVLRCLSLGEAAASAPDLDAGLAYAKHLRPPSAGAVAVYHLFWQAADQDLAGANARAEKLSDVGWRALARTAIARRMVDIDADAARTVLAAAIADADRCRDLTVAALALTRAGETAFLLDAPQSLALWSQAGQKLEKTADPVARGTVAAWLAHAWLANDAGAAAEVVRAIHDAETRALLVLSLLDRLQDWRKPLSRQDLDYEVTVRVEHVHSGKLIDEVGVVVTDATTVAELPGGRQAGPGRMWAVIELAFGNEGQETIDLTRWRFRLLHTGGEWVAVEDRQPPQLPLPPGDEVVTQELAFAIPTDAEPWCLEILTPGSARVLLPPRPVVSDQ